MAGANLKMGVTGVSQFKQDINTVKNSMKTLDAQLALCEKEFKSTGDAQAYMQEKTELLQLKLEQQKHIVASAEAALKQMTDNGVNKASNAFQEMQRQVLAAKSGLLDTQNKLDSVATSGEEAGNGVDAMNTQLKNIGKGVSFINVTEGISKLSKGIAGATKKAIELGKRLIEAELDAGAWADELQSDAKVYGVTPEQLQRMRKTARLIDTDVETIVAAKKKLKKERAGESKDTMGAFAALGIDPATAKDSEDLFWRTGEALMQLGEKEKNAKERFGDAWKDFMPEGMDSEYLQEDYAQKLLGKSWAELIPLFEAGREEYEKTNDSWTVLSQDQLDSLGEMDDEYQKLQANFESLKMTALAEFATPMKEAMTSLNGLMGKFTEYLKSDEGKAKVKEIVDNIIKGGKWVIRNKDAIFNALKVIAAGLGLLKLGSVAANIGRVVVGLKQIRGGGGGTTTTPTTTPTTTAATGGGFWTTAKAGLKSALPSLGQTALFALPAALGVQGILQDQQMLNEWRQKGIEVQNQTNLKAKMFGGSDMFDEWDALNSYLKMPDRTAGTGKMQEFAENYFAWFNDQMSNTALDKLTEGMTDEEFDRFHEAMQRWKAGTPAYSDAEMEAMYGPLNRALEIAEKIMGDEKGGKTSEVTAAAEGLKGLPRDIQDAIRRVKFNVSIDGQALNAYVNAALGDALAQMTE